MRGRTDRKSLAAPLAVLLSTLCLLALAACVSEDSPAPGKEEVLERVSQDCPSERYELVSATETRERPQRVEYTFASRDRDLRFTAVSEVTPNTSSAVPFAGLPRKQVTTDYAWQVKQRYLDDVDAALADDLLFEPSGNTLFVASFADVAKTADALMRANDMYAAELAHNDAAWLEKNPVADVRIAWTGDVDAARLALSEDRLPDGLVTLRYVEVTGTLSRDDVYNQLAGDFAQHVTDGDIPDDPDLPDSLRDGLHVTEIWRVVVAGSELPLNLDASYDDAPAGSEGETPALRRLRSSGDAPVMWDEERGCYEIVVDFGREQIDWDSKGHDLCFEADSWTFSTVARALGGEYGRGREGKGGYPTSFAWRVGEVAGKVTTSFDGHSGGRVTLEATCEGGGMEYWRETVGSGQAGTLMVPLDDLAALFGATARVDEETGVAYIDPA